MPKFVHLEVTPTFNSMAQNPPLWNNVADWSNLSQVHPGAGAASSYCLGLWPANIGLARRAACHIMLASPGYVRLASWHSPANLTQNPPVPLPVVWDRNWGFEAYYSTGVNNLTFDITTKWNALVAADPNWQHQIMAEVKGSGVLYMCRLEVAYKD